MKRRPKDPGVEDSGAASVAANSEVVLQIKVWLIGVSPMVWRRVLVPAAFTLRALHGVIQVAMGWEGFHLFQFCLRAARYGSWELSTSSSDITLAALRLRKDARFIYEYDLNIPWRHEVRIEDLSAPEAGKTYPICVAGDGACPPEDCGGPDAFMEQANQDVTFLTDGGEEVRALTQQITPGFEHVLDWFHITMRVTVLKQYARGVAHHDEAAGQRLLESLESIKWLLWHGNRFRSREEIGFFESEVDGLALDYPHLGKFARAAHEFAVYIGSNASSLINYGERYRAGERISSCLAESTVNAVISKRFAKRQQMQWTKRGAHLLLQIRTRALDGTLRPLFERWYPGLANDNTAATVQTAAA